jgi:Zn-dependent protease with chaperone function
MAHELSSLVSGDYLRRPGSFKFETAAYGVLAALALLSLISIAMVRPGHSSALTFGFAALVWAYLLGTGFLIRRVRKLRGHDPVRADTVAATITENPEALASAVTTMDGLVNRRRRYLFPPSELGLDYMFAPPHNWSETPKAYLERRARELDYNLEGRNVGRRVLALQQSMDELSEQAQKLLEKRTENIARIVRDRGAGGGSGP